MGLFSVFSLNCSSKNSHNNFSENTNLPRNFALVKFNLNSEIICFYILRDLYAESNVAELLHQIVSAADYLHSRRVIHLDLKSDNMLVDDGNHLKIIDFGSAQSFVPGQPLNIEHIHGFSDSKGSSVGFFFFFFYICIYKPKYCLQDLRSNIFNV